MDFRGWNDIAYSFVINHTGLIYEGRGPGVSGAHTAGHNTISHAICLLGNFNTTQPTAAALGSLKSLVRHGHESGWWPQVLTGGHRDTRGGNVDDCPGNILYNLIPAINEELAEDDMPSPSQWTDEDKAVVGALVFNNSVAAQFGGPPGSSKRKPLTDHIIDIKALIGGLDLEGVSEAELDEAADRIIAAVPDAVLARLKVKL
jgi:hypothetical protein